MFMKIGLDLYSWHKLARTTTTWCILLLFCAAGAANAAHGQEPVTTPLDTGTASLPNAPAPHAENPDAVTVRNTPMHILEDQKAIWTSPAHIRINDLNWLVPMAAITAGTLVTDRDAMIHVASHDKQLNQHSVTASNAMLGALAVVPAADFGISLFGKHEHARETAILSAETAVDDAAVEQGLKLMFWRERPGVDNANGKFWQSSAGADSSFPSSHAVFAWSMAAMLASEYPSTFTRFAVYSLATGVSVTRVMGQEHFPSDVLVGSAAGWLVGHYVYKLRHRWEDRDGFE